MLALPVATVTQLLPAARGNRTVPNMLGTTHLYRGPSLAPIAIGQVSPMWCDDCAIEVVPESHTYIYRDYDTNYPHVNVITVTRWNTYPCHLFACGGYRCEDFHETVCENCSNCESHCDCSFCYRCEDKTSDGTCENCDFCENCCECSTCDDCGSRTNETVSIDSGSYEVCYRCRDNSYGYCDDCDTYYHYDFSERHEHYAYCECESPEPRFTFPLGDSTFKQNERVTVELPSGTISREGLNLIVDAIAGEIASWKIDSWTIRYMVFDIDAAWQTREGNYTKRVGKLFYKAGYKLSAALLSTIGNIANEHTAKTKAFRVELTRDLNGTASDFYHEDSCWWSSDPNYSISRCAFKQWGGIGLRSYEDDAHRDNPGGRAWIQPLDETLKPTCDAIRARAYLVYNGYGNLDGYAAARIVAHITNKTYKKIDLVVSPQYVNGTTGYLISDSATCAKTSGVSISGDAHVPFD